MDEIEKVRKELEDIHEVRCAIGAKYMEYVTKLVDVADDPEKYDYYEQKLKDLEHDTNVNKDICRELTDKLRELEQHAST